jgi:hypothetical protein
MQCLSNFIGVRWQNAPQPESNLWINDLQGISLKMLDSIANEEQITFFDMWNSVQARAVQRINTDVVREFSKRYRLYRLVDNTTWLKSVDLTQTTAPAAQYLGFEIEMGLPQYDSGWQMGWVSSLQVIHVQSLSLYLIEAGPVTIHFFNIIANSVYELTENAITINGVAGWNEIPVYTDFYGVQRLFIGYDGTSITAPMLPLDNDEDWTNYNIYLQMSEGNGLVRAGTIPNPATQTTNFTNNTYGLVGVVGIRCRFENLVCDNKTLFATPMWYLLGAELMAERIYSDRVNRYTTIDIDKAQKLRLEFEKRYALELESACDGIELSWTDCCLEPNGQVRVVDQVP